MTNPAQKVERPENDGLTRFYRIPIGASFRCGTSGSVDFTKVSHDCAVAKGSSHKHNFDLQYQCRVFSEGHQAAEIADLKSKLEAAEARIAELESQLAAAQTELVTDDRLQDLATKAIRVDGERFQAMKAERDELKKKLSQIADIVLDTKEAAE